MPLLVETTLDGGPARSLGLYAVHPIAAGTPVWRFRPPFDQAFSEHFMRIAAPQEARFIRRYGRWDPRRRLWLLAGDHGRFIAPSTTPNTRATLIETVAARDIAAGEEITRAWAPPADEVALRPVA